MGQFQIDPLPKFEETVVIGERRYDLGVNRYPGVIHPQGQQYLKEFRRDPCATFTYDLDGVEVTKTVYMLHGENSTVVEYTASAPCTLELRPLIAFRGYHSLAHEKWRDRRGHRDRSGPGQVLAILRLSGPLPVS